MPSYNTGYTRVPAMPPLRWLQEIPTYQAQKPSPTTKSSPLNAVAAPFEPKTQPQSPRQPAPPDKLTAPRNDQHQRQDSAVQFDFAALAPPPPPMPRTKEEDITIRTLQHRWNRTRSKLELPCLKCSTTGECNITHAMIDCKLINDFECKKIRKDWDEIVKQVEELGLDLDISEPGSDTSTFEGDTPELEQAMPEPEQSVPLIKRDACVLDHAAYTTLKQTIDDMVVDSIAGRSTKVQANSLKELYGEELWTAPCARCKILSRCRWHHGGTAHRMVDCEDVAVAVRIFLKEERGEIVEEKEVQMLRLEMRKGVR